MVCSQCHRPLTEIRSDTEVSYLPCAYCAAQQIHLTEDDKDTIKCTYCRGTGIDPYSTSYNFPNPCPMCKSILKI